MSCCAAATPELAADAAEAARLQEFRLAATAPRPGVHLLRLAAPDLRCGACIAAVEEALSSAHGVLGARANLAAKTITVEWREDAAPLSEMIGVVEGAGYRVFPLEEDSGDSADRAANRALLTRLAVSGFAAANIMLLSVSVWAGAEGAARDLMHWVSALIALPTVVYAGQPFFRSALAGLRAWRLNMDAPISLAILLAAGVSLFEVLNGGEEAYFDAAVSLIFLLLLGRWLDGAMRAGARSAARRLAQLAPRGAWVLLPGGERDYRPLAALKAGDRVLLSPGDRAPVDGVVEAGEAQLDRSILTGESAPVGVAPGRRIEAGALALDGALTLRADAPAAQSTLAEVSRLVAAAEDRKSGLARLADKAARVYAPTVHLAALLATAVWLLAGASPRDALLIGVAVLIVTCPCALGLAAPMAQAVACGALFRRGIMLKDGAALERLATVRGAFFDKTGVLTLGRPNVLSAPDLSASQAAAALALASSSRHPFARAVAGHLSAHGFEPVAALEAVREHPGSGVEAMLGGERIRLGAAAFCDAAEETQYADDEAVSRVWLRFGEAAPVRFVLTDAPRPGAAEAIGALRRASVSVEALSGDLEAPVRRVAEPLALPWRAKQSPQDKIAAVRRAGESDGPVLMVGDGLNDAPALAAAEVSMAPSEASDVGRAAADLVFTGASLSAVSTAYRVARRTRAIILQNFAIAAGYNLIAVPLAAAGAAGPLEAAVAMSTSSLLVTLNALRIGWGVDAPSQSGDRR